MTGKGLRILSPLRLPISPSGHTENYLNRITDLFKALSAVLNPRV